MPVYNFHAVDSQEIEGKCELPDDESAVKFAEEIARQMTVSAAAGATVSVFDENDEPVCEIVVEAATLH